MTQSIIDVQLPDFHPGQWRAYDSRTRYSILRCGRRWGKTEYLGAIGCRDAMDGWPVAYFAPDYKRLMEFYHWCAQRLLPVTISSSEQKMVIRTLSGGKLEFWSLNDANAGRGRKYKTVLIDEAAFGPPNLMDVWRGSIKPTLLDMRGECIVASNTNGIDESQFFWQICNEEKHGFGPVQGDGTFGFHAPSSNNPYMPLEDIEALEKSEHPLVFREEYLAEFISWSGESFFKEEWLLDKGRPVPIPPRCDRVYAVIDTAIKDGKDNDGTAVLYCAQNTLGDNFPLILLDWDLIQVEGATLENWLPAVFKNLENYARVCRSRFGSVGVWIEDKGSGTILIQQSLNKGWPAQPIDSKLTAAGKDARAFNASAAVGSGKVKISQAAYEKTVVYKDVSRNHLTSQIANFRIGDKDAHKRADDLLDTFCYGVAIGLGNREGF